MKNTLTTIFAFAVIVFASNANSVMAKESTPSCPEGYVWQELGWGGDCVPAGVFGQMDELKDPNQTDNERDVADSGNEDSVSSASTNGQ